MPVQILPVLLILLSGVLAACGDGGGGGGSDEPAGGAGATGSVAILVTDGPVPAGSFQSILLTFTRIELIGGDGGPVEVFRGRDTIDLRDYEDAGKFVALGRDVPTGIYEKIRMYLAAIELVPADGSASIFPKLPPKLDLLPPQPFRVSPGRLLRVEIDFDAGKSVHIVRTGNGGYRFRPVAFVEILSRAILGKRVLLEGVVAEVDLEAETFVLCEVGHVVAKDVDGRRSMEDSDESGDREDHCVDVVVVAETSVFDRNGDPADLDVIDEGDEASVLGRFVDRGESLRFRADVVQEGPPGTALALDGIALSAVQSGDTFLLEIAPGQGFGEGEQIDVWLLDGAKVYSRRGAILDPSDLRAGDAVRVIGQIVLSGDPNHVKASVVVIDLEAAGIAPVAGAVVGISSGGTQVEVMTDAGARCVAVGSDTRVYAITATAGESDVREIDPDDLAVGDDIAAYGPRETIAGCLDAQTVTVFTPSVATF